MKKLFTISALICFSALAATAQDKNASETATQSFTKTQTKKELRKTQPEPMRAESVKIEQRVFSAKRIGSNNSKGMIMTEEQKRAKATENAAKPSQNSKKTQR